jgi:hypothetical protein
VIAGDVTRSFDVAVAVHALLAVSAVVVLLVLRAAAGGAQRGSPMAESAARSFTGRTEFAGRVVHLVPLSGVAAVWTSSGRYGFDDWFVLAGLGLWVLAAACLEWLALPSQRAVAAALRDGTPIAASARRMALGIDASMGALVLAAILMVIAQR